MIDLGLPGGGDAVRSPQELRVTAKEVGQRLAKLESNLRDMREIMLDLATHIESAELALNTLVLQLHTIGEP